MLQCRNLLSQNSVGRGTKHRWKPTGERYAWEGHTEMPCPQSEQTGRRLGGGVCSSLGFCAMAQSKQWYNRIVQNAGPAQDDERDCNVDGRAAAAHMQQVM